METKQFGNYIVYSDGRVYSVKRSVFLKPFDNGKGYQKVTLSNNGISKSYKVHRLVAECFISKVEGKNQVNHKNGINPTIGLKTLNGAITPKIKSILG